MAIGDAVLPGTTALEQAYERYAAFCNLVSVAPCSFDGWMRIEHRCPIIKQRDFTGDGKQTAECKAQRDREILALLG